MAEVRDFLMPDLGEGLTEGEIVSWLVEVGDTVTVDQPVAELSTEKAVVQVPTPFAGRVVALHGSPADLITVGSPLISIDVAGDGDGDGDSASEHIDEGGSGNVLVGYGTASAEPPPVRTRRVPGRNGPSAPPPARTGGAPPASPLVRRQAAELGIDLSTISGTGPGGVVTRADLERAQAERAAAGTQPASPAASSRSKLTGVDRIAAERLARSHREAPTATAWTSADATQLLELRDELKQAHPNAHVTPFALLLRLCIVALGEFPRLNAHFDSETNEVLLFDSVHLGVAVQTDRGLIVPVIRNAGALSVQDLAAEVRRVADGARSASLDASALSGSTFTVSNFGAFGVDGGTAIINPPEAAILGVGQIADRPWAIDGQLAVRKVVEMSLVFDHRVADGAVAGGFTRRIADLVERPGAAISGD